jgi:hypothetical protein
MKTINNKKNRSHILTNQQFKLGTIINPIINPIIKPIIYNFNNIINNVGDNDIDNLNNINGVDNVNNIDSIGILGNIDNIDNIDNVCNLGNINKANKSPKPIDVFFGSIIKPPSPISNSQFNNLEGIVFDDNNNNNESSIENNSSIANDSSNEKDIIKNDKLKQIYPKLSSNNSLSNIGSPLFTNIEIKLKIDKLSENELCEIFKIIKNNNEKYSIKKNGIFINENTLKKITITEICNFIEFCENNNKFFDTEEKTRDIYREIVL